MLADGHAGRCEPHYWDGESGILSTLIKITGELKHLNVIHRVEVGTGIT